MKYLYPASHDLDSLSDQQLSLKIARHCTCSSCGCFGLHPDSGWNVVLDSDDLDNNSDQSLPDLDQYASDDEDGPPSYLEMCACGHDMYDHGADQPQLGRDEFVRKARVAIRADEILQDVNKLLDFTYVDGDVLSLRKQMVPFSAGSERNSSPQLSSPPSSASSVLSDDPDSPPPPKKRRVSYTSSSALSSDDESEQPLAARVGAKSKSTTTRLDKGTRPPASKGQRGGKKGPGIKTKTTGQMAPTSLPPPTGLEQALMNGTVSAQPQIKVEDKLDEQQLSRLTTGVTVDSKEGVATTTAKPEKAAVGELRRGIIVINPVENDGEPRSLIILTGLKTLFQKQLPKMPREYIARLVYDNSSKGVAIVKRGLKVVGGICYRPFPHRGFAEIVFFATASVDQVKGYGAMLMDHFKAHIRKTYPDMMYFLTYADNYAVGYFEKQGFSKDITLDRSVWAGYIKDYEGGTIMQCTMLRKVDYLDKPGLLKIQTEAVMQKIREMSRSHVVYPGLPQFQNAEGEVSVDYRDVPGLRDSGWSPNMSNAPVRIISRNSDLYWMQKTMRELKEHSAAWAFLQPVNGNEVVDYYDVIKEPMDFSTMSEKLEKNEYPTVEAFISDAQLVFDNCRKYNVESSNYAKNATKMEKFLNERVAERGKKD
ncbi:Histone GCN5 superfamily [Mycena indigotica]|uniref:histone acetyltransferase n=1 Tax=Mycena indigotica TaxID=2126181 RepID=A0A8H6WF64_9AGAR|nr:Histone GCN5 superfamily [Mycena indigotica]KAF7315512.1 Histone GCN5 superfamily [Mycena indigotica]